MLAIRMQRTGRKGHAMFRVVVQDSRRTPTSGKVVALLGSYDPHAKSVNLQKDKAAFYLEHGAQPSERVVRLFASEGISLPDWVKQPSTDKKRTIRNLEKLRRNRPAEAEKPAAAADDTDEPATEQPADAPTEAKTEEVAEPVAEEKTTDAADDSAEAEDAEPADEAA